MMFIYDMLFSPVKSLYKSILFFILILGILLLILGINDRNTKVYKLEKQYNMFRDRDALQKQWGYVDNYPWENIQVNSKLVTFYNNPRSGFGKDIGFKYVT